MKKRYYLSMLSIFLLTLLFDVVYIPAHKTMSMFLVSAASHFIVFVPINMLGIYFLFKPVSQAFRRNKITAKARMRVPRLAWYSSCWIFLVGLVYFGGFWSLMSLASVDTGNVAMDKIPASIWLTAIPSTVYIFAMLPAFITWFLINDFTHDLKSILFRNFEFNYPAGKKKIGWMLLISFIVLGLFPSILVTLELIASRAGNDYGEFSDMTPLEGLLPDRIAIFIGMICAVVFITRSFTKPIYSLLKEIKKVHNGDYSTRAAIVTSDEIGVLTNEFNDMVQGLQERELIRDTFGKYVTNDVANAILDNKINLEGETRLCTILVTDIENYTTISEKLKPAEIITTLNEYFTVLVNVIQRHKGIVNEFIGDAVFAMFNVPVDDPDHALNAVNAAKEIDLITSSQRFGQNRQLTTRIGINTGTVVAGNVGSPDRMKYTVVGDEVNIAARLEQLNKKFSTRILVGENTFALVQTKSQFTAVGDVRLKGKQKTIKVFEVNN
ncbi:hypothetical protein BH11BAC3_BH11BAC3_02410 [soil metagenome]